MLIVRSLLLLTTASTFAVALTACSTQHTEAEGPAMVAGSTAISEEGRDPFGTETAAAAATGEDLEDAGVPCANFSLTIVGPFVQFIGEAVKFSGHAQDDAGHQFMLAWSASGGELSDKTGDMTTFTCMEAGVQTISMSATLKAVCSSALAHAVTCLKPAE